MWDRIWKRIKKLQEKKNKTESEVYSIFATTTDTLKPGKDNEKECQNFNISGIYKDCINDLKKEDKQLMWKDTSEMTKQIIDERDLHLLAKISTMKTIAKEYKNTTITWQWLESKSKSNT